MQREQKLDETIKRLQQRRDRIGEILEKRGNPLPKSDDITAKDKNAKKEPDNDKHKNHY